MNKKIFKRLDELIKKTESLPKDLYTESEFDSYSNADEETQRKVLKFQYERKKQKNDLIKEIFPFLNVHIPENSHYFQQLSQMTFEPHGVVFNSFHYKNNEAWKRDRNRLIDLLKVLKSEFKESQYAVKKDKSIFRSRLFWAIVSIVGGTAYFLGTYLSDLDSKKMKNSIKILETMNQELKKENRSLKDSLDFVLQPKIKK